MSILRSFGISVSRQLAALTALRSASLSRSQVCKPHARPRLRVPFLPVMGLLLASVGNVCAASFALDQKLTSADFTTDIPANIPDLEFGQAIAVAGNWMAVGAPQDIDGIGTVYLYERVSGTWAYRTRLAEPSPQGGSQFGAAVDVYEAGGLVTVIVGAPLRDASSSNQGIAYVFSDTDAGAGFSFTTATLTAPAEANAHFGASVALFADSAAVGAPNAAAGDDGSVSIRGRNTGGTNLWGQTGPLKTGPTGSGFGTSVDLHGEYLIVGAPLTDNASSFRVGAAYVYRQDQGGAGAWGIKHTLTPSSGQAGQVFGQSVGIWDSNVGAADSVSHSMVGAPLYDDGGDTNAGHVTFFADATINAQFPGADPNEQLGYSVALEATNGIAGRPNRTISGQPNAGSVNTYSFNGTLWATNTINLAQTGGAAHNFFGYAVDLSGLVAVTSAPGSLNDALTMPPGAVRAGAVATFEKPAVTWAVDTDSTVIATFDLPNTATSQIYAYDVDMTSNWLVVGVRGDAQRGGDTGAVYVYRSVSGVWTPHSRLTGLYSQAGDQFGSSVAIDGTRIIVGAPNADGFPATVSNAGAFYVFVFNGTHWVQTAHIQSPNPSVNGFFGADVDYQGDVLVVGASGENGNRGRAYAYRDLSTYANAIPLNIAAATVSSGTGFSVSVYDPASGTPNDEVIAVGAYNENSSQGAAYVLSGASFATTTTLVDPNPGGNRYFGYAVSIHSGRVAVGAPTATSAPSGRVIVFSGSSYGTATTLPAASGSAGQFGFALHLEGSSLVVGSPATAARAGLASVYGFSAGNWTEQGPLQAADLATFDEYGTAVTQSNGVFAVGAPLHNANSIADSGAAYVFSSAPEVTIAPTTVAVAEAGSTTNSFVVALNQSPATNVTIALSFDPAQMQVDTGSGFGGSPQTVTLTPANAVTGVSVAVRAVDDGLDEVDPHTSTITTATTASSTPRYHGLAVDDISVSIADNDSAEVRLTQSGGSTVVTESGVTDTYTLVLGSQPAATVNVAISFPAGELSVNGDNDGTYNTSFTAANWNVAQIITVAAINDRALEGDHGAALGHVLSSADPLYNGVVPVVDGGAGTVPLSVAIADNESAVLDWSPSSASAPEGANVAAVVRLDISADPVGGTPSLEGTIGYSASLVAGTASAADVGSATGATSFTNASDLATNALSIAHLTDSLVEGTESYSYVLALGSVPAGMNVSLAPTPFTGTIGDANTATLSVSGGATVGEGSGSAPLTVTLTTSAGATLANAVSVPLNLVDGTATFGSGDFFLAGPASSSTLSFAAGSAGGATQVAAVSIANDARVEGTESFSAALGTVTGAASVSGGPVTLTITDNDTAVVGFQSASSSAPEASSPHAVQAVLTITADGTGTPQLQDAASVLTTQTAGTASTPADYALSTSMLNFPAGSGTATIRPLSVVIVNDAISEGDETFDLGFGTVTGAITASGVHTVTIADNDLAQISVTESAGSTAVAEGGAGDSYSVVLGSQPAADVSIQLAFDASQLIVNGDADGALTLTFTPANWDQAQTVAVVAVDDTVIEASPHSSLIVQTAASADAVYNALNPADVTVSIAENDLQQITFVAASSTVAETTASHQVGVRLSLTANGVPGGTISSAMTANLTFTAGSAGAADAALVTTQVSFPAGTPHNSTLPVSIALSNDRLLEGAEDFVLGLALVSAQGSVSGTHNVTIDDDESAVISFVSPTSAAPESTATRTTPVTLIISGTGSGAAELVAPASVTITHTPGSAASPLDYSLTTSAVTFAAGSASGAVQNAASSVVDDLWVEGDEGFTLGLGPVLATGVVTANGLHALTITDNDSARFGFAPGDDSVAESVGSFSKPVLLSITGVGSGTAGLQNAYALPVSFVEGTATEPEDFTVATPLLNVPAGALDGASQSVTATIVDDLIAEGPHSFQLQLVGAGLPAQITLGRASSTVSIVDNDVPALTVVQSGGTTAVAEAGATDTYTVALASQPTADVVLTLVGTQVTPAPTPLTFTAGNWNVAQTVTVTAIDDAVAEGSHPGSVATTVSSSDPGYAGLTVPALSVTISDNDSAGVTLVQSAGTTQVAEGGATDSYTAVLTSEPTANVVLTLAGSQVSTSPVSLTFTAGNWNVAQTVTVTAIDDAVAEGNHSGSVTTSSASSDSLYNGLAVAAVAVSISDNESAGVTLTASGGSTAVTEGGATDTYTVVLTSEPTAAVTVTATGLQVSTSPPSVVFDAQNWNQPQTVTVAAIDDAVVEGAHSGTISSAVTSSDGAYNGIGTAVLPVSITDNDTAGLRIADARIVEGNSGISSLQFVVTLDVATPVPFTVGYGTADGSAVQASDYASASGTLSFVGTAGETHSLSVPINGDSVLENDETFRVDLAAPSSALVALADSQGIGTIDNDDSVTLSTAAVVQAEGNTGSSSFSFVLQLNGQVQDGFSVRAQTRDGTATAGSDYVAADVNVSFDGSLNPSRSVVVGVLGDTQPETQERFWLDLSTSRPGVQFAPASVAGDIVNDDLSADLEVSIVRVPGPVVAGEFIEYEARVRNLSAVVDVPAAQFTLTTTPQLIDFDWTCVAEAGASCPASGAGLPDHAISLNAGTAVVYRIRTRIRPETQRDEVVLATASVVLPSPYSDPVASNNSDIDELVWGSDGLFRNGFETP